MRKYYLLLTTILASNIVLQSSSYAQIPSFSLELSIKEDTSNSVFSQCYAKVNAMGIKFIKNESFSDFLPEVYANRDSANIEFRVIGQTAWLPMFLPSPVFSYHLDPEHIIYPQTQLGSYINLLPLYDRYSDLWNIAKYGCTIELRYKDYLMVDSIPAQYYYSNLDTLILPLASDQDILAFEYLKSNHIDVEEFSTLAYSGIEPFFETHNYLVEHCPNSLIGEISRFNLAVNNIYEVRRTTTDVEFIPYYTQFKQNFVNSPSGLIRNYIKIISD